MYTTVINILLAAVRPRNEAPDDCGGRFMIEVSVLPGMKVNNECIMNADENVDETGDSDVSVPRYIVVGQASAAGRTSLHHCM